MNPVLAVDVGTLPNIQHAIGGTFEILSVTRIRLRGFSYDGQGPGKWLFIVNYCECYSLALSLLQRRARCKEGQESPLKMNN